MGIFVFITNKFTLYSWNFADVLIIVLSRALYYKFKMLNEAAEMKLVHGEKVSNGNTFVYKMLTTDSIFLF